MKPLPDLADDAAMLLRGKRSALEESRKAAHAALRDAHTAADGSEWESLALHAGRAHEAVARLLVLADLWADVNGAKLGDETERLEIA